MKKLLTMLLLVTLLAANCGLLQADGPAPNSGDGVPDGSGIDSPGDPDNSPAPGSGDCVPDGSGVDSPSGPNN
ncbi:hypothetical protein ACFLTD_03260 [Elusimicrobiota bacterium]